MVNKFCSAGVLTALAVVAAACTVHQQEVPGFTGPSDLAQSLNIVATPDSLSQNGSATSLITVTAVKEGKPLANLELRFDMLVDGVAQDFGTLRPGRTAVTNASGVATVVYTVPPSPPNGLFGTCQGLPGTCVQIVASPTGSAFETAVRQSVQLRLAPPSVLTPGADPSAPTARFTFSPTSVQPNTSVFFNASSSTAIAGHTITSYAWDFGDGTTKSGVTTSHDFGTANAYIVTLTVTDNFGLQSVFASLVDVKP